MRHYMDETLLMLAEQLATLALQEDVGPGDLTGGALLDSDATGTAELKVKQDGVISGLQWLEVVFGKLDDEMSVEFEAVDGDRLRAGTIAARVKANLPALVAGERTALNLIQRLSGIATLTGRFMDAIEGTRCMVFDHGGNVVAVEGLAAVFVAAGVEGVTVSRTAIGAGRAAGVAVPVAVRVDTVVPAVGGTVVVRVAAIRDA